jgi:pimeloyl-ACP methyl ester carboxylesterase
VGTITEATGIAGWARLAPTGLDIHAWSETRSEAVALSFTSLRIGIGSPCEPIVAHRGPPGPIIILVHGIGSNLDEWRDAMPNIIRANPSAVFLYKWKPFETRDNIVDRFATGIGRIVQCWPEAATEYLVMAHSAGGVIASLGASWIALPATAADTQIEILTVASPLAGTKPRTPFADGRQDHNFLMDLGTAIRDYGPPAHGVRVTHLRTQYPDDPVMAPEEGHRPNDPRVGVFGSPQIDLPAGLDHTSCLTFVSKKIADGSYRDYFARPTDATIETGRAQ